MPRKEPLVSIVMRTFNRAHFLPRVIASVREQTYENWELIIVDDASTDSTPQVVAELRSADRAACGRERIKLIRMDQNSGGESTGLKNIGIRAAAGKYIALLDDDDEWMPGKLEKQVALLEVPGAVRLGFVGCSSLICSAEGGTSEARILVRGNIVRELLLRNTTNGSAALVRSDVFKTPSLLYDESLVFSENRDLWLRISAAGWAYDYVDEPLVRIHQHRTNMTNTRNTARHRRRVQDAERMFLKHQDLYRRNGLLSQGLRTLATYCLLSGDYRRARHHFTAAIRHRFTDLKSWTGFILACSGPLGLRFYRALT